jgi:hypothetical protein
LRFAAAPAYTIFEKFDDFYIIDIGTWRSPGGTLADLLQGTNIKSFAGLGARLVYTGAFDTSLRIDYGIDIRKSGQRGFVVGIGQYF